MRGGRQQRADGDGAEGGEQQRDAGVLRKNGMRRVRIAKITSAWVASDSTNQPAWNSGSPAWKIHSMTPKVAKSNTELTGPKNSMKRLMNPTSQREGRASCSGSTLSVGMASWLES